MNIDAFIRDLPIDIQETIFNITIELRKPKHICEKLLNELKNHKGLFIPILNNTPVFFEVEDFRERYSQLSFLLYKFVFVLNEYKLTSDGHVNNFVLNLFHNFTRDEIVKMEFPNSFSVIDDLSLNYLHLLLLNCWHMMTTRQRLQSFTMFK
jgi:hypothetical protein